MFSQARKKHAVDVFINVVRSSLRSDTFTYRNSQQKLAVPFGYPRVKNEERQHCDKNSQTSFEQYAGVWLLFRILIAPAGLRPRGRNQKRHPKFPRVEKYHFFRCTVLVLCEMELGASKVVPFNFSARAQGGIGKYLKHVVEHPPKPPSPLSQTS